MKILKKVFLVLLSIIVLLLIVAIFMPKDYSVEREVTINKPKDVVFNYVKLLRNQKSFSTWENMDPNMKNEFRGIDGTVGSFHSWDGNPDNVGVGSQEIKGIIEGERVDIELKFIKPFESTSPVYFITENNGENATKLKWGMKGNMEYPMNILIPILKFEEFIGNEYGKSLQNLKVLLEKK
jgi:hypothetical protein